MTNTQHTPRPTRNKYGEQSADFLVRTGKAVDMNHARKIQAAQRKAYSAIAKARGES